MNSNGRLLTRCITLLLLTVTPAVAQERSPRERELEDRLVNTRLVLGVRKSYESGIASPIMQDTTWVGHSYTDHWSATQNWWNLYTGEVLPGTSHAANALWDWDHTTGLASHGIADSLAGWWPVRLAYDMTGGYTLSDDNRPWWALDFGNQANYVINQGSASKRTKGVVGVWHSDPGNSAGSAITWSPLSGTRSAWCGLRQHGDNSVMDPLTGNAFNQSTMEFNGPARPSASGGTATGFPGYASQWDQMLYRDFQPPSGTSVTVSFKYRTRMSTGADRAAATRTGWFHGDPLGVTPGNFISSTSAGVNAPVDSFMVYVGVPVQDAACVYSDGITRPVYDPARRWFSEVLRIFEGPSFPYFQVFSTSGNNPPDTLDSTPTFSATIPAFMIDAIRTAPGNSGLVRLVFRVKTNRGYDDESSATATGVVYTSRGWGAAILDDVTLDTGSGPVTFGDFEGVGQSGPGSIDNRFGGAPPGVSSVNNWRSTGKPPAVHFHADDLSSLSYEDVCGAPGSPSRLCNLSGTVISAGNHDRGEGIGDYEHTADRELMTGMVSPTINLVTSGPPNAMGITPEILDATDDWYIRYDVYTGAFDRFFTGCTWTIGFQSYPARQWNGTECWGPIRVPDFQMYNPDNQCFHDVENGFSNGLIVTSNSDGIPDSLRLYVGVNQQCFRFGVSLGCNPTSGGYFDNVALGFVDIGAATSRGNTAAWQAMSLDNDQWFGDAFPSSRTADPDLHADFDTTSAFVKTDLNIAPCTGNLYRAYVLGDSAVITAPGDQVRVDLVFRIRPGPGNSVVAGQMGTGLRQLPTSPAAATPGDGSFWGEYLASNDGGSGFGTPGGHVGGRWDPLVWNSARCDTAEKNIFPIASRGNLTGISPGLWASTYHEADPKFQTIGSPRFRCFVVDTSGSVQMGNIVCDGSAPSWLYTVPQARTGWDGSQTTREFIKILPDGLFTPGTNIQYFYRKSRLDEPAMEFAMAPDTNMAWPQRSEGQNFNLHRFAAMSVLPDQWGIAAFDTEAVVTNKLMLTTTTNFDRGRLEWVGHATGTLHEEWIPVGISVGVDAYAKWGLAYGLWGPGGGNLDYTTSLGIEFKAATRFLEYRAGGTLSSYGRAFGDMYVTTGTFSNTQVGPTLAMLRRYLLIIQDPGKAVDGLIQPYRDQPLRGLELFRDFLFDRPLIEHGLWFAGPVLEWITKAKGKEPQLADFEPLVKAVLRSRYVRSYTGNLLGPGDAFRIRFDPSVPGPWPNVHGVWEPLGDQGPVFDLLIEPQPQDAAGTTSSSGQAAAYYDEPGVPPGPYIASVYAPRTASHPGITLIDAFTLDRLVDRTGSGKSEMLPYAYQVLTETFAPLGQLVPANRVDVDPTGDGPPLRPSARALGNPVLSGGVKIQFAASRPGRVEVTLHDIAGRHVRTLADRSYAAGEHVLHWDCRADGGQMVSPGVYLLSVRLEGDRFTRRSKLVVMR